MPVVDGVLKLYTKDRVQLLQNTMSMFFWEIYWSNKVQAAAVSGVGLQGLGPPTFWLAHPIKILSETLTAAAGGSSSSQSQVLTSPHATVCCANAFTIIENRRI